MKVKMFSCFFFTMLVLSGKSQDQAISSDSIIKKWELATINIEANTPVMGEPSVMRSFWQNKMDSSERMQVFKNLVTQKVGSSGTAIYLKYENIHFLVTARHVLEDLNFQQSGACYEKLLFPDNANIIDTNRSKVAFVPLMLLDSRLPVGNVIFSIKDIDIAIVALDPYDYSTGMSNIPEILEGRGNEPIEIQSIDTTEDFKIGDLTYSIGFPDLSMVGKKSSNDPLETFQSNSVTVPLVSIGKVLKIENSSPYLISDVFVYHGHSGGPLICNNKLVGIVHGANLELRQVDDPRLKYYYFLNGNQFIKAKYIMPVLRELVKQIQINRTALKAKHST